MHELEIVISTVLDVPARMPAVCLRASVRQNRYGSFTGIDHRTPIPTPQTRVPSGGLPQRCVWPLNFHDPRHSKPIASAFQSGFLQVAVSKTLRPQCCQGFEPLSAGAFPI